MNLVLDLPCSVYYFKRVLKFKKCLYLEKEIENERSRMKKLIWLKLKGLLSWKMSKDTTVG